MQPSNQAGALRRGDTQKLVDAKKEEIDAKLPCWMLVLSALSTIVTSTVLLYIGFAVQPVDTCGGIAPLNATAAAIANATLPGDDGSADSWKTWYRVDGFVTIAQGIGALAMTMGVKQISHSDKLMQFGVYSEQGREEEGKELMESMEAQEGKDLVGALATTCCCSCFAMLAVMFGFGWGIWGFVLYFRTRGTCTLMTKLFIYIVIYQGVMSIVLQCCQCCKGSGSHDDEEEESDEDNE